MSDRSPLSSEDQALLELARHADEPTATEKARVRAALVAQLGVGVGLTATAATSSTSAAAASAGSAASMASGAVAGGAATIGTTSGAILGAKVVVTLAVVLGAGFGGASIYRSRSAPRSAPAPATTEVAPPVPAVASEAPHAAPAIAPSEPQATASAPIAVPSAPSPVRSGARVPPPTTVPASALEAETRLVRGGDAALRAGDPAAALSFFDEHARTYPTGILAEERAAERILTLCALGRVLDARIDADRFLRDRPRSPLAARVRASCGGGDSPNF